MGAPEFAISEAGAGAVPATGFSSRGRWLVSLPLVLGVAAYLYVIGMGPVALRDGDTYWHVATGRWILENGAVPTRDPFSHSMPGAAWTAHEWLSEVLLAQAYRFGGWTTVLALTAVAMSIATALLARALLRWLEPAYAFLFASMALFMTASHILARPHILAFPLMVAWLLGLVRACEERRAPSAWLLPVMTVWANMHGGFTLGLVFVAAFGFEAVLEAQPRERISTARTWAVFMLLALIAALLTPHGIGGLEYTWQVMANSQYALRTIGEWQSPDFQVFQPLELWLLGGVALVLFQGLKLPAARLLMLLGLMHLALKHQRYIELLGFLAPLLVAAPFGHQWAARRVGQKQADGLDRLLRKAARPAGLGAVAAAALLAAAVPAWQARFKPVEPPLATVPAAAVHAARAAGLAGPVLNTYDWGGYLAFEGIPMFVDGRADMYGDAFMKDYREALLLEAPDKFERLLSRYAISWTLLRPGTPAIALLDHLPGWRRVYADKEAVVHAREVKP